MLKRTWARMDSLLKSLDTLHEDIQADVDDLFDKADLDLGPLPEGVTEEKTVEEKVLPDGTRIKKIVTRRVVKK